MDGYFWRYGLKKHARRLFNVYSGEERKATLFALLGFILSLAVSSAWKLADVLFIIHVGAEELPQAYACVALLLIGMALLLINAFNRFSPTVIFRTLILSGMGFFGCMAAVLWFGLEQQYSWFWFFLKVLSQAFFIQSISSFWTDLDQYFHFQDAKRLFTLFNCSIYIGTALAGLIIQSGALSIPHFFTLVFVLWCAAFYLTGQIDMLKPKECDPLHEPAQHEETSIATVARIIVNSPFTLFLMLSNLTLFLLLTTTEYNYLSIFEKYFENPEQFTQEQSRTGITHFMGSCIASVGLGNLIMGWFLYSRLIAYFGVAPLIFVTPIAYLATYLGWPLDSGLMFAVFAFVIVEGIYPVIADNNFNLLLNAVPSKIKYKVRVMIESFCEPVGMLISAGLLSLPMVNKFSLGLTLAAVALFLAIMLRKGYFQAIFSNLTGRKELFKSFFKKGRSASETQLLELVESNDSKMQLLAFKACVYSDNVELLEQALAKTDALETSTRIALLHLLDRSPYRASQSVSRTLDSWEENPSSDELLSHIRWYRNRCPFEQPRQVLQAT
ncbi:MAG: hypothetical protein JSR37_00050 [Verrucomicrobia bacterium]|nr:hypothetical protein [Verrucomicrobiota bacterium]